MPKLITIWGMSRCGSTLLSFVLGSLPGVKTAGESHSIHRDDLVRAAHACSICATWDCPILSRRAIEGLARAPRRDLFPRLLELYRTENLVVSNKLPSLYREMWFPGSDGLDHAALVVFRDPRGNVDSHLRRNPERTPAAASKLWCRIYSDARRMIAEAGVPVVSVQTETFAAAPEEGLRRICDGLGLPFSADALRFWEADHHQIGGNSGTHVSVLGSKSGRFESFALSPSEDAAYYLERGRGFFVDERWKTRLSPRAQREVMTPEAERLYAQLVKEAS